MTYSELAKRARLPLGFILGIAYLFAAHPTPRTLLVGGSIALTGIVVRAWASGHIRKNESLATDGPYAHSRNPLYFGSFLIAVGFALAAHWSLLAGVVAFFVLVYYPTIQREVDNIRSRFPDTYTAYAANVPLFFPRVTPWRDGALPGSDFALSLYMKHGEWKVALTYVLAMIWLALRVVHA